MKADKYIEINKASWNKKVAIHVDSEFYDQKAFLAGKSSLKEIDLELLGDIKGKKVLHLQCHFGQDSISLARLGAEVTAVDFSDDAIKEAKKIANQLNVKCNFICSDIYELPQILDEEFDIVFTSYGVIGWLPDMDKWANVINTYLKPGGKLVFIEFHPVVWMFDDDFTVVKYKYSSDEPIIESYEGTYADQSAVLDQEYVMWNHSLGDVVNSLVNNNLEITSLEEYDYSNYPCFSHVDEYEKGKYRIKHLGNKIPMMYSITAVKK